MTFIDKDFMLQGKTASELYIDYAILCGENITFTAVQASDK